MGVTATEDCVIRESGQTLWWVSVDNETNRFVLNILRSGVSVN